MSEKKMVQGFIAFLVGLVAIAVLSWLIAVPGRAP